MMIKGLYTQLIEAAGDLCTNEKGLVLFCHKFIYAPYLPDECVPILVNDTRLTVRYNWVEPTYNELDEQRPNPSMACSVIRQLQAEEEQVEEVREEIYMPDDEREPEQPAEEQTQEQESTSADLGTSDLGGDT